MNFSYLENIKNNELPPPVLNAGLYSQDSDISFSKKPWGNDYRIDIKAPDAAVFSSFFYAKHHIPSAQNRPGNNSLLPNEIIQKYNNDKYNIDCYNNDILKPNENVVINGTVLNEREYHLI